MSATIPDDLWLDPQDTLLAQHARLEHVHAVAGLFSSLPRGERPRRVVQLAVERGGAQEVWRFVEAWSLGADDQTVLLTILSLIAQTSRPLPRGKAATALRLTGERERAETIYLETSGRALCQQCGWEWSGRRWTLLQQGLDRLSHTSLDIIRGGAVVSGGLLLARGTMPDGRITIAISPILAQVLLDDGGGVWARIDLRERRRLQSDTAQILHAWLSAWLRPGRAGRVGIDTLVARVWPGDAAVDGTLRKRRHAVRQALREITSLPEWRISGESARGVVTIHRPGNAGTLKRRATRRFRSRQKAGTNGNVAGY